MKFLRSLADFFQLWPFCVVITYLTLVLPAWLLALNNTCVLPFILTFGAYIVLNIPYFVRIQIDLKKHPKVKLQQFWKEWIWTFGWLVHQTNSVYKVSKLKQNFWKRKVVTGKTLLFVIGQFCTLHSICINIGFCIGNLVIL